MGVGRKLRNAAAIGALGALLVPGAAAATTITGVHFSGSQAAPTVTVTGTGFGAEPIGSPAGCEKSGEDFGKSFYFKDKKAKGSHGRSSFAAGEGTACVGLFVNSWSETSVVFHFGSAYGGQYQAAEGDSFQIHVLKAKALGTIVY